MATVGVKELKLYKNIMQCIENNVNV